MPSRRVVYVLEERIGRNWMQVDCALAFELAKDRAVERIQRSFRPVWDIFRIVEYTSGKKPRIRPVWKEVPKSAVI